MLQLVAQGGKKKVIYYFLATNMPLHFWGLDGEKSIMELQRGQVNFPHDLHSHSLAGCFLSDALPQAFNLDTTFGFYEFSVEDDKFFVTRVVDPSEWIWRCRMPGSLDSVSSLNIASSGIFKLWIVPPSPALH